MSTFRNLILIVTLALLLCPIACYAITDEATMLQQAREQYQEGNYYFASTWIERVLKEYPATAGREQLLLMLLKSYISTGRTAKATAVVNTLRQEYPTTADSLDADTLKKSGYLPPPQYDLGEIAEPPSAPGAAAQAPAPTSAAADGKAVASTPASTPAAQQALPAAPAGPALPKETKVEVPAPVSPPPPPRTPTLAEVIRAIKADQAAKAAVAPAPAPKPIPAAPAAVPALKAVAKPAAPTAVPALKEVARPAAPAAAPALKEVAKPAAPAAVPALKEIDKKGAPPESSVVPALPKPAAAAPAAVPAAVPAAAPAAAVPAAVPTLKEIDKKGAPPESSVVPAPSKPAATAPAPPPGAALPARPAVETALKAASEPVRQPESPAVPENPRKAPTVSYTLQIGEYVVKSTMVEAQGKLVHAGLEPVVEQGPKKKGQMVRLYVGEFPNQAAAKKEVQKLLALKLEGFFLMGANGKCQVYAGSYAEEKGATRELQRIAALGRKLSLKPVTVAVPTFLLTAGNFPTRSEAQNKAQELEKQGVKALVIERVAPEQ